MPLEKTWIFTCDYCGADDVGYMNIKKPDAVRIYKKNGRIIKYDGLVTYCNEECAKEHQKAHNKELLEL